MFRFNLLESIGYQTQRFIPGSRLQFVVLADQRRRQTLRAVNEIDAKPAFDAEQATVDRAVRGGSDANHFAVFDIQVEITANATKRTGRSHLLVRSSRLAECFLGQSSDRAGGYTGAAEHAIGFAGDGIERRSEFGIKAAPGEIEYVTDLQFLASPNAAAAQDAFFIVPYNKSIGIVNRVTPLHAGETW